MFPKWKGVAGSNKGKIMLKNLLKELEVDCDC